ncbi:MAG: hypothetical protein J6A79_13065, partial [Clostridia bacterium]|nr:hypothetical protein [Clostridia bacterium]
VIEEPKEPEVSPETAEYNRIRELYPDDLVLFQRGDFYELYGEDAQAASELAQLTLTTRELPGAGRVNTAGFPYHALNNTRKSFGINMTLLSPQAVKTAAMRFAVSYQLTMKRRRQSTRTKQSSAQTAAAHSALSYRSVPLLRKI